jgi:myo-inositol-1(or 4)-monophosphatase
MAFDARVVAERAARLGGEVILRAGAPASVETKAAGDYVTEVDRESERVVGAFLAEQAPGIPLVGEEEASEDGPPEVLGRYWLVDPLDGTTNFLHRFPAVGVSVALVEEGRPIAGAVHAPFLERTWSAARGEGASVDGRTIRIGDRPVERAVVATGFPFRRKALLGRYLPVLGRALERFEDIRRPGAAALDLAWVAEGVFDGFFELSLGPWDLAAGALLIEEAGGVVSDWDGGDGWLRGGEILAGSPAVHAALRALAEEP